MVLVLMAELNCFYLKFVMWAKPDHPYVLGRLFFIAAMGAVSIREAYDYLSGITFEIGQSAWIAISVIITEAMICVKFGWDTITTPFPQHIKIFWVLVLSMYIIWSFWPLWKVDITLEKPEEETTEKDKDE